MADTKTVWFIVKRLYLNDNEPSNIISLNLREDDKVTEVTQTLRSVLELDNLNLILRLRNARGSVIPLNGKITLFNSTSSRPFTLEIVERFQSVEPKPNSLELSQYAESLNNKLIDIDDRIERLESNMEDMHERRKDKVHQEISNLENTVTFLKKRLEEAETIEWRGMFVKNPLW